jgi:beta-lactamase regulating signal transducer with metallopeptidase domain
MNLLATEHLHRLGWVVLHSLWQAAAVAAVLAVVLRLLPRRSALGQEARYLVATLALFSLPVACAITWTLVEPPDVAAVAADRGSQAGPTLVLPAGLAAALDAADIPATAGRSSTAPIRPADEAPSAADAFRILTTKAAAAAEPWLPTCAALWLAGVIAAAVRLVVGWALTRRLVATAAPLPDASWQARLTRWTTALGIAAPIRLLASARVDVPIVVGWLRPVVIWPVAAVTGMPPEQIDAILAHELAHVRRHDVLVNLLQSVIEAVFFHHPAAWWISAQVRAEREHCADELAIRALAAGQAGSRISYATALLSLEERRQAILAAAANGGSLGDRIRRLAGIEQSSGHPARLAAAVVVLVAVVATLAAPPGSASRQAVAADVQSPGQTDKPAPADELPADTSSIKSLTPEQAKKLVREFKGRMLYLPGLTTLDADTAKALAEFKGDMGLSIPSLVKLNPPTALVLVNAKWDRRLDKLSSLDAETARALAAAKMPWSFPGLTRLDAETARALVQGQGFQLSLNGLTTLDVRTARELAKFERDMLFLDGVTTLEPAVARELAGFQGCSLNLRGLAAISDETAAELSKFNRPMLFLSRLATLSDAALTALVQSGSERLLDLGLETLPPERASLLARFQGEALGLSAVSTLDPDAARALAEFKGQSLSLGGLKTLGADAARALAEFKGKFLRLGLTTLDADTAGALAAFKGEQLELQELNTLDPAVAKALDGFDGGNIFMSPAFYRACQALQTLTPNHATLVALAAHSDNYHGLKLERISALDGPNAVEVAKILATAKGRLALPNLEKISPKTLAALLEKEDVQLPLIETLEMIPEPDGSPTEDFVIPDGSGSGSSGDAGGADPDPNRRRGER